jgi:hypothetical protein
MRPADYEKPNQSVEKIERRGVFDLAKTSGFG